MLPAHLQRLVGFGCSLAPGPAAATAVLSRQRCSYRPVVQLCCRLLKYALHGRSMLSKLIAAPSWRCRQRCSVYGPHTGENTGEAAVEGPWGFLPQAQPRNHPCVTPPSMLAPIMSCC